MTAHLSWLNENLREARSSHLGQHNCHANTIHKTNDYNHSFELTNLHLWTTAARKNLSTSQGQQSAQIIQNFGIPAPASSHFGALRTNRWFVQQTCNKWWVCIHGNSFTHALCTRILCIKFPEVVCACVYIQLIGQKLHFVRSQPTIAQ